MATESALERFKRSELGRTYFELSPVSLGLGRIALGLLLLFDVLRRWADLDIWYTNAGLMPNHTMLWAPQARMGFSIFYSVSELYEAQFFVVLITFIYVCFLLGYRTKLMQVLALVAQVSLNCRVHYLTNGGDNALSVLLLWSAFLPLGDWLSIDALRRKMKRSQVTLDDNGVATLRIDEQYSSFFVRSEPRFEWAGAAMLAQLGVVYFFNYVHKDGIGWAEGSVVHDVLHQDRIVTPFGVWLRPFITPEVSRLMTKMTLVIEAGLPVLLALPVRSLWLRRAAVFFGVMLHVGFMSMLNLGVFSPTMICFWLFLIPHEDAVRFVKLLTRPAKGTLYFDSDCGVCTMLVKALLCMQYSSPVPQPELVFKSNQRAIEEVGVTAEQVQQAVLWVGQNGEQRWQARAFVDIAKSQLLLRPFSWVFTLVVMEARYDAFARRRHEVSAFLGQGVCGLKKAPEPFSPRAPISETKDRWVNRLGRAAFVYLCVVFVVQTLAQNRWVPASIKPTPPFWVTVVVEYAHFFQGWGMFANSPRSDLTVVVRGTTVDGRLVDPLSERASPRSPPGATEIVTRLDHSEFFCDYISRISNDRAYEAPLRDWVLAYPKRTGNPNDALRTFQVVELTDATPAVGQSEPTNRNERVLISYP